MNPMLKELCNCTSELVFLVYRSDCIRFLYFTIFFFFLIDNDDTIKKRKEYTMRKKEQREREPTSSLIFPS